MVLWLSDTISLRKSCVSKLSSFFWNLYFIAVSLTDVEHRLKERAIWNNNYERI
jgi:hypothetical protein